MNKSNLLLIACATALLAFGTAQATETVAPMECQYLAIKMINSSPELPWGWDPVNESPIAGKSLQDGFLAQLPMLSLVVTAKVAVHFPGLPAAEACAKWVATWPTPPKGAVE